MLFYSIFRVYFFTSWLKKGNRKYDEIIKHKPSYKIKKTYVSLCSSDPSILVYGSQAYLPYLGAPPGYLENLLGSTLLRCLSSKAAHIPEEEAI